MRPTDLVLASSYFDCFVDAFATFKGERVATLFVAPVVALRSDGSLIGLATQDEITRYYQTALDKYRGDGCRLCRWSDLSVTSMGTRSILAAATWDLLRDDGTVIAHWRQSYSLSVGDGGSKAFSIVSHAQG